jgi:hypothetical protein
MTEDFVELTDAEEIGKVARGASDERGFRARFIQILREQPNHTMFITDLVRECSREPIYYLPRQTCDFHLEKMEIAGIVEIEDIPVERLSGEDRLKIQAVVKLKKDVRIFVKDL